MDIVGNGFLRRLRVKFIHTRLFTLALSFIAEQLRMFEAGGAQAGNVMFQNQAGPQNEFWEHEISRNWQSNQRVARTDQQPTQIYFGHFELWAIKAAFTGLYIMQCRSNDSPRIEPLCY